MVFAERLPLVLDLKPDLDRVSAIHRAIEEALQVGRDARNQDPLAFLAPASFRVGKATLLQLALLSKTSLVA